MIDLSYGMYGKLILSWMVVGLPIFVIAARRWLGLGPNLVGGIGLLSLGVPYVAWAVLPFFLLYAALNRKEADDASLAS
ncbi:MAG: hypothetical protein AAFM91_14530 [Pseudomonadota bacterium]